MELAIKELEGKAKAIIDRQDEFEYCHCGRHNWLSQLVREVRDG